LKGALHYLTILIFWNSLFDGTEDCSFVELNFKWIKKMKSV